MTRHVEVERLSAWIAGDLGDRDAGVVRTHLDVCAACGDVAADLRAQVAATRDLARPEPPPTLWAAIEGEIDQHERGLWARSWRAWSGGAVAGAFAVLLAVWGARHLLGAGAAVGASAEQSPMAPSVGGRTSPATDPLLAEAERELEDAAASYERAVARLRKILEREQALWDPETRARVGDRLARLDEAVAHSRDVARSDPGDASGADMLFSAYRRQIDFLAEAVHRGSPAAGEGLR